MGFMQNSIVASSKTVNNLSVFLAIFERKMLFSYHIIIKVVKVGSREVDHPSE